MSYVHPLYLGFFDAPSAAVGRVVVRKPLDRAAVVAILAEFAPDGLETGVTIHGRDRLHLEADCLCVRDIVRSRTTADLIVRICRQTGCEIYDWNALSNLTAERFLSAFEHGAEFRRQARLRRDPRRSTVGPPPGPNDATIPSSE